MKRLYKKFLIWSIRQRITILEAVDTYIASMKRIPNVPDSVWAVLYWCKYSLERKIEKALIYLER